MFILIQDVFSMEENIIMDKQYELIVTHGNYFVFLLSVVREQY